MYRDAGGQGDSQTLSTRPEATAFLAAPVTEHDDRSEPQSLVPVDQSVVADDRVQQRSGFVVQRGVGVRAERRRTRTGSCRLQQPDVAHLHRTAGSALGDVQEVLEVEEDH